MYHEEQSFLLRFTLEASFPEDYDGDEDNKTWVREWETRMKPQVIKQIFDSLRRHPGWTSHIRNRGASSVDEIEVVVARDFSQPLPFSIGS
jgi:hypothetical protein